jgi:hypothetical protein
MPGEARYTCASLPLSLTILMAFPKRTAIFSSAALTFRLEEEEAICAATSLP